MAGFAQGLSYLATKRVDLSAPEFGTVAAEQILAVASKVPHAEAMFFPPGTKLDDDTLGSLRQHCPNARCLTLGCEVTEKGYLELRRQHGQHDEALATALEVLGLPEGVPNEPEPELEPLLCRVLEYLETPQYLRHALFPAGDRALSLAGVLPSLDVPSLKLAYPHLAWPSASQLSLSHVFVLLTIAFPDVSWPSVEQS